jgi:hypothetical protein
VIFRTPVSSRQKYCIMGSLEARRTHKKYEDQRRNVCNRKILVVHAVERSRCSKSHRNGRRLAQKKTHLAFNREIICDWWAHTYVTVISPTTSGKYPISNREAPRKAPDGLSHRPASHPIKQTDDGQWTQRTDVLGSKRINNTREQEARQAVFYQKKRFYQHVRARIIHSSRTTGLSPAAFAPVQSEHLRVQLQ